MVGDGPRFVIQKPATIGDDGSPSDDLNNDAKRVMALIQDERHLCADTLLTSVESRIVEYEEDITNTPIKSPSKFRSGFRRTNTSRQRQEREKVLQETKQILEDNSKTLEELRNRAQLFRQAKRNLNVNDDWTLSQTLFGVTTYYRREADGSLSIKLEGRLEGVPLFEQVAVLREVDLHCKWAPFVSSSLTVAHLGKLDTVGWFVVGVPTFGLMRDGCFRAIGCDSIAEDGSIILVGQGIADRAEENPTVKKADGINKLGGTTERSVATTGTKSSRSPRNRRRQTHSETHSVENGRENVDQSNDVLDRYLANDPVLKELDLPEAPTRMGTGRMTIRKFQATIHVESPTSVRTLLIANIDPNLNFLPQSLLEFIMKKMCGVLLGKLQAAAKRITKDPVRNPHARKMRLEHEFYQKWLIPKFQGVCDIRGWKMQKVAAFNLTAKELAQSQAFESQQRSKGNSKIFHSLDDLEKKDRHVLSDQSGHSSPNFLGGGLPSHQSLGDSDSVSALSMNSSQSFLTAWKNNPLAAYMRDLEEKTQARKEEEIARGRERAANRLKPKVLDPAKQSRLQELRAAKERRKIMEQGDRPSTPVKSPGSLDNDIFFASTSNGDINGNGTRTLQLPANATESQRRLYKESRRRDLAMVWTRHGLMMRVVVTVALMATLFSVLYKESLFGIRLRETLFVLRERETGPWYMPVARDVGTIMYMAVAAIVHSCFCYVSLMYAFTALQLGNMAGRRAKRFYSENVHVVVALSSGSMVLMGVIKSLLFVLIRVTVWRSVRFWSVVKDFSDRGQHGALVYINQLLATSANQESAELSNNTGASVWETLVMLVNVILPMVHSFRAFSVDVMWLAGSTLNRVVFESNTAGRLLGRTVAKACSGLAYSYGGWLGFMNDVVDQYEGRKVMCSWREDAFDTTRTLLSYSAFFLFTLLILFNLQAKAARGPTEVEQTESEFQGGQSDFTSLTSPTGSNASSKRLGSQDKSLATSGNRSSNKMPSPSSISVPRQSPVRNRFHTFDAIEEEPSHLFDAQEARGTSSVPGSSPDPSSPSKKKRRRFRLRRRKRSNSSSGGSESRWGKSRTHSM